jgi:cobalt/nickel transport system permease protein
MYEELLENIAQKNAIRGITPYFKLAAGLGAIILCLASTSYIAPLYIALVLTGAILVLARIDPKMYAGLFILPFWFTVFSVAGIILISGGNEPYWNWSPLPWLTLSVTKESINEGVFVFCRVIGGMSALCFIALTTPMTDLFIVMRQCRIPEAVIDLAMLIYRAIFIIMDQIEQIYNAQVMRLGYTGMYESINSFAAMCGAAFIASWNAGEDLVDAMDARCYDGKFAMLGETRPVEPVPLFAVTVFLVISSVIVILSQNITLI